MQVIKKDGTYEEFDPLKIVNAVTKSAVRIMIKLSDEQLFGIADQVKNTAIANNMENIPIEDMHRMVEMALEKTNEKVCKSYRDYRNYKIDFVRMMDRVYERSQAIRYIGDKENGNTDSALVATKRSLIYGELNKRLYRKFFMTVEERKACKEGYIYIHDQSARLDTINCFDRSTRFITSCGVQSFNEFSDGDEVIVPTHLGNWKKAIVHSYGWQKLQRVYFKRGASNEKSVLVTQDHRWILKDGSETTNLKVGDKLIYTPNISSFNWNDLNRMDKKLWCIGFGLGDGSIINDNGIPMMYIRLCGDKVKYAERFKELGYTVTSPESLNGDMKVRMPDVHTKEIPLLELNYENILYYINGFMCADGNKNLSDNSSSEFRGVQVTGSERNYQIYRLLNIAGYYVTNVRDLTYEETNYGLRNGETKSYQCYTDCGDRTWVVTKIEPATLNPKSKVWCLEVEDDHSFLLEGGIPTGNCCLFNANTVMNNGFEMGNIWYNEPKTLDTAFDVLGDIILSTASQQYGGFTVPEVDKLFDKYAQKSYDNYYWEYLSIKFDDEEKIPDEISIEMHRKADKYALKKVRREFDQGWQGIEMKLNTVGSSRGDYPFITMTFGLSTTTFGKMCSLSFLEVHKNGQGKKGQKRPVLFPKLVFLYDKNLHGPGCVNEDIYEAGIECSSSTMYPKYQIGA